MRVFTDINVPSGLVVVLPGRLPSDLVKGLTPCAGSCMVLHMAEDTHPPIQPSNSMAASAAFFEPPAMDAPPEPPAERIAVFGGGSVAALRERLIAEAKDTSLFDAAIPDAVSVSGEKPSYDPAEALDAQRGVTRPEVEAPILPPLDPDLFRRNDVVVLPEPDWGNRFKNPILPRQTGKSAIHSALGPSAYPPQFEVYAEPGPGSRPSASIYMRRTRRLGRQRWTWELRENHTDTAMCFGRFYVNYDEAVEYALRSTGGYLVSPVVRGDKPKGRV